MNASDKIKILVTEDHAKTQQRLRTLFNNSAEFELLAICDRSEKALSLIENGQVPDILLVDLEMPGMKGDELISIIREKSAEIRIAVFTVFEDESRIYNLLKAGIKGYLLKDTPDELLSAELRVISLGGATITERVAGRILDILPEADSAENVLSERETEVLNLIALGLQYREIAEELEISPNTVRRHIENTYRKLEVNSKIAAVKKAEQLGIFR